MKHGKNADIIMTLMMIAKKKDRHDETNDDKIRLQILTSYNANDDIIKKQMMTF